MAIRIYTAAEKMLLEDGLPEVCLMTAEERRNYWIEHPPTARDVIDYRAKALQIQREKNQRNYQLKKEKETKLHIRRQLQAQQQTPLDLTGMLWDTRKGKWIPDPFYKPQEDDLTKLNITPYDGNGLILGRGKTSIKDDASPEDINNKVLHAIHRAGKKTVKVELTRNGTIVETRDVTDVEHASAAALAASAASEDVSSDADQQETAMATNKKKLNGKVKGEGVIATIVETMGRASGVTVEEMAGILSKKFPQRKVKSMTSTCKIQLSKNAKSKDKDEKRGLVYYR